VSWLGEGGKPEVRLLEFFVDANSPNIVESKSLKLYLNSFNNTRFASASEVRALIEADLTAILRSNITVLLKDIASYDRQVLRSFTGTNLDSLDIKMDNFDIVKNYPRLSEGPLKVEEVIYSNLLKSNCPVTNQPDWASIQVSYRGQKIDGESLLKYFISFRNHNEFHEQCVERIFCDISTFCVPDVLTVYARYTRRGGIDINPIRSSSNLNVTDVINLRHIRQ
jgi:7-cyano-7-deazaguanine reductase